MEAQRLAGELDELDNVDDSEPAPVDIEAELTKVAAENEIPETDVETEPDTEVETTPSDEEGDTAKESDAALKKRVPPVQARGAAQHLRRPSVQEASRAGAQQRPLVGWV